MLLRRRAPARQGEIVGPLRRQGRMQWRGSLTSYLLNRNPSCLQQRAKRGGTKLDSYPSPLTEGLWDLWDDTTQVQEIQLVRRRVGNRDAILLQVTDAQIDGKVVWRRNPEKLEEETKLSVAILPYPQIGRRLVPHWRGGSL